MSSSNLKSEINGILDVGLNFGVHFMSAPLHELCIIDSLTTVTEHIEFKHS